jgi:hypothetical protein
MICFADSAFEVAFFGVAFLGVTFFLGVSFLTSGFLTTEAFFGDVTATFLIAFDILEIGTLVGVFFIGDGSFGSAFDSSFGGAASF